MVAGGDQRNRSLYEDVSSNCIYHCELSSTDCSGRGGKHVVTMYLTGAYLNAAMSSIVVYIYSEPVLEIKLSRFVPEYEKFIS